MKRILSAVLALGLSVLVFTGCTASAAGSSEASASSASASSEISAAAPESSKEVSAAAEPSAESTDLAGEIRLAGMTGPTAMGMVKLLSDNETGASVNKYHFTLAGSADEITPKLVQGELDIAAVPANLASVLYNNTQGQVQLLAINNYGVLYLVEKGESIQSLQDVKGKTIYATGKGSTPEYTLRYLLSQSGIDPDADVTIEWKSEPTEVVALLAESEGGIAMLPQPYVTVVQTQVEGLRIAANLGEEWKKLGTELVTGVVVARKEFVEQNPKAVEDFLDEYEDSTEWVNENVADAAALIEKFGITKAPVAQKALPLCNIDYEDGDDMKQEVSAYLQILMDQNPKAIGGAMPGDDFYYKGTD